MMASPRSSPKLAIASYTALNTRRVLQASPSGTVMKRILKFLAACNVLLSLAAYCLPTESSVMTTTLSASVSSFIMGPTL